MSAAPRPSAAHPPALAAFLADVSESYLRYAQARVGTARARAVLAAVRADLDLRWDTILREDNLARCAWSVLTRHLDAASAPGDRAQELRADVGAEVADALLLHYQLGLTLTHTASLTGASPSQVAVRVLTAERHLGPHRWTHPWRLPEPPTGA